MKDKLKVKSEKLKVDEFYIIATDLIKQVFGDMSVEVVKKIKGKELVGIEYEPLFVDAIPADTKNIENAFKIYEADFVTTEDGTGVVHTAVRSVEDGFVLGKKYNLQE